MTDLCRGERIPCRRRRRRRRHRHRHHRCRESPATRESVPKRGKKGREEGGRKVNCFPGWRQPLSAANSEPVMPSIEKAEGLFFFVGRNSRLYMLLLLLLLLLLLDSCLVAAHCGVNYYYSS